MMTSMKAWQFVNVSSGLENSIFLNASAPAPSTSSLSRGQVIVEVISASINPADYKLAEATLVQKLLIKVPAIPGLDFCGRVVATHSSDQTFKEGQLIFGALEPLSKYGTLSQFIIAPISKCALLPEGVDPDQAAAMGTAALTAYQALKQASIQTGSKVFINGGSGGTGTFGLQFAKILGAEVTTTCSTGNIGLCRNLGADNVLDYKQMDIVSELTKNGQVFDLVVDNVGDLDALYQCSHWYLKPSGKFVQVSVNPSIAGMASALRRALLPGFLGGGSRAFHILAVVSKTDDLERIAKWLVEGKVKAVIDEVFNWEDVPRAYKKLKAGHAKGKIIVRVMAR